LAREETLAKAFLEVVAYRKEDIARQVPWDGGAWIAG